MTTFTLSKEKEVFDDHMEHKGIPAEGSWDQRIDGDEIHEEGQMGAKVQPISRAASVGLDHCVRRSIAADVPLSD